MTFLGFKRGERLTVAGVGVVRGLRWVAADGGKRAVARVQRAVMGLLCRVGEGVDGGQP